MSAVKQWRNKRGQSIIEITLLTPILLVALYIPADFGIAFFTAHLVQNAAREGARIGSKAIPFSQSEVEAEVRARLPDTFPWALTSVTATHRTGGGCMEIVRVTVTGTYNFFLYRLISLIGLTPPSPIIITRTTDMRYEGQKNEFTNPC